MEKWGDEESLMVGLLAIIVLFLALLVLVPS